MVDLEFCFFLAFIYFFVFLFFWCILRPLPCEFWINLSLLPLSPSGGKRACSQIENKDKRHVWSSACGIERTAKRIYPGTGSRLGGSVAVMADGAGIQQGSPAIGAAGSVPAGPGAGGTEGSGTAGGSARIAVKKAQLRSSPRPKKLEKLAVYSSCKVYCVCRPGFYGARQFKDLFLNTVSWAWSR